MSRGMKTLMMLCVLGVANLPGFGWAEGQIYLNEGIFKTAFPITNDAAHRDVVPSTPMISIVDQGVSQSSEEAGKLEARNQKLVLLGPDGKVPDPSVDQVASQVGQIRIGRFLPELAQSPLVTEGTAAVYMLQSVEENQPAIQTDYSSHLFTSH